MSDHLVRVEHLKAIQRAKGWNDSDLARHCRRTPQQIRSWFLPVGHAGMRQIGEKLARALEDALQLERYALDSRPASGAAVAVAEPTPPGYGVQPLHETPRGQRSAREMPILLWAQLTTMLAKDNAVLRGRAPHLETFAPASRQAKFVEVNDDSMAPDFRPGDHVLLDPTEAPHAGDTVLLQLPSGELYLRVFRPRTAHVFDGVALNANYQALSSKEDQAEVVAVMIEHRRYRQRG